MCERCSKHGPAPLCHCGKPCRHNSWRWTKTCGAVECSKSWHGNAVSYRALHTRLRRRLIGPNTECTKCGGREGLEVALIHGRGTSVSRAQRPYSPRPEDYIVLCISCHRAYDKTEESKQRVSVSLRKAYAEGRKLR